MSLVCVTRTCASSTLCVDRSGRLERADLQWAMHQHLRAWRHYRNMTLEQVGNIVGKKHTTVSRWEQGTMKLSTADLVSLAQIYGATPSQLIAPPEAAEMVATLDRTQRIVDGMEPDTLEQWLAIGERLRRPTER